MKSLYTLILALFISASSYGQLTQLWLDYNSADEWEFGTPQTYTIQFVMNMGYTKGANPNTFQRCVVAFDSLYDVNTLTTFDSNMVSNLLVDSILTVIGHKNVSGTNDTLIVKIINLTASGYPGTTTLWADTIITNTSLSPGNNWHNPAIMKWSPDFSLPGMKKFGVEINYYGSKLDTCAFLVGFNNLGPNGVPCPYTAARSLFYPNSFAAWTDYVSTYPLLPDANGFDLYQDCNQNGQFDAGDGANFLQDIVISAFVTLTELPYNTIKGKCFIDYNQNSIKDGGEPAYTAVMVESTGSSETKLAKPNSQGVFKVKTINTGSVQTSLRSASANYVITPAQHTSNFISFSETDSVDFALVPIPGIRDIRIRLYSADMPRIGRDIRYTIEYSNAGTDTVLAGNIYFIKDSSLVFVGSSPGYDAENGDSIRWNFLNFVPGETRLIQVFLHVPIPPAVVPGDKLSSMAYIEPLAPNENPTENYAYLKDVVVGSYDPNDKKSLFGEEITKAQITEGQYLTYLVRFQNTGNDTAFKVVVKDTLDSKLDANTFDLVSASHSCEISLSTSNVMTFTLNNILLVDSNKNEPASHGYICYRMKPKTTLSEGNVIKNTAHIYFDYNLPVATNTAVTTVVYPVLVNELSSGDQGLWLFPNPAKDKLMLYSSEVIAKEAITISVMNSLGEMVQSQKLKWTGEGSVNIKSLPAGIYFLVLKGESGSVVRKFVKE